MTQTLNATSVSGPVLGIECATFCGSVAIVDSLGVLGSVTLRARRDHSVRMMPSIDRLLSDLDMELKDLAAIAVSLGPGSFTGVRIGISTAKGFARGANLPLIGISTLHALACRFYLKGCEACPMIDARRGQVYAALFAPDASGLSLKPRMKESILPLEALIQKIRRPTVFLGDGANAHRDALLHELGEKAIFPPASRMTPSAEDVAALGVRRLAAGETDSPHALAPLYIQPAQAQVRRKRALA
ncbi:tRNA (adenosine(37)-N6)-threonylcarbamoyltransferase complex dimerization subunit type 1 TsaB [Candidatus Sumerlaeota bacterium]|nr:tRNA (adenosine(37)-N6)-threonylcarbamoyltransferase complex dimerization subunit type 1 TsaB [Candidatus Sumerlaeota bacterium]